jgi:nicotinamidase-related amidase
MKTIDPDRSTLLVVDFQQKLMPAIDGGEATVRNARRLLDGAALIGVPAVFTEQYPKGLGATVPELATPDMAVVEKTHFDAARAPGFYDSLPEDRVDMVVAGCEAHVCVLQTVLGLLDAGRNVFIVADAIGSRLPDNRAAAIARMERHGAEMVTTEMVLFEWLVSSEHPRFKETMALIR